MLERVRHVKAPWSCLWAVSLERGVTRRQRALLGERVAGQCGEPAVVEPAELAAADEQVVTCCVDDGRAQLVMYHPASLEWAARWASSVRSGPPRLGGHSHDPADDRAPGDPHGPVVGDRGDDGARAGVDQRGLNLVRARRLGGRCPTAAGRRGRWCPGATARPLRWRPTRRTPAAGRRVPGQVFWQPVPAARGGPGPDSAGGQGDYLDLPVPAASLDGHSQPCAIGGERDGVHGFPGPQRANGQRGKPG